MNAPDGALLAVNDNAFEYSRFQAVGFTFNKPLIGADTTDLIITNLSTGATIPASQLHVETIPANTSGWTYRWRYTGGILPDGNYQAVLPAGAVTDMAGRPTTQSSTASFFSLAGDANRDRIVDVTDLGILATNWQGAGKIFSQGDFNYDGKVDVTDLGSLATNWQRSLPTPSPSPSAASALFPPVMEELARSRRESSADRLIDELQVS
jgi:hypothetical protein